MSKLVRCTHSTHTKSRKLEQTNKHYTHLSGSNCHAELNPSVLCSDPTDLGEAGLQCGGVVPQSPAVSAGPQPEGHRLSDAPPAQHEGARGHLPALRWPHFVSVQHLLQFCQILSFSQHFSCDVCLISLTFLVCFLHGYFTSICFSFLNFPHLHDSFCFWFCLVP